MKQKLAIILWMGVVLAEMPHVYAQDALYIVPEYPANNTLIREYKHGIDIVYNDNGQQSFLYIDRQNAIVIEATHNTNYQVDITDMEIYEGTLYFCGRLSNVSNVNFVGFFNVNDLFFGSQNITILPIYYSPVDVVQNNIYLQGDFELSEIEVYKAPGTDNETHIYLIGDVTFNNPLTTDYSCIMEIENVSIPWGYNIVMEPDRVYYFNDLTVTDNYLVVVGNKHGGTGEYMHCYPLPVLSDNLTFDNTIPGIVYPNIQYWATSANEYYPISKPLIETLSGDAFATTCFGMWQNNPGVIVTWYSNYGTMVSRYFVPNITLTQEFRDLKYNAISDNLFLMPDHTSTGTLDAFYGFNLSSISCSVFHSNIDELHSLDYLFQNVNAVASGIIGGILSIMSLRTNHDNCILSIDLPVTTSSYPQICGVFQHEITSGKTTPIAVHFNVNELSLERICGDEEPLKIK